MSGKVSALRSMEVMNPDEGCHCGACCYFKYEDLEGWGCCDKLEKRFPAMGVCVTNCGDLCTCDGYVSEEEKRHYLAVLIQANRYRRDDNVPSIYRMPDPKELGKAIDFVVDYCKRY